MTEQMEEQPRQFGQALARGTHHGGTAYITCTLCDGRAIAMLTLSREQFSDQQGRERILDTWSTVMEADHNSSIHGT